MYFTRRANDTPTRPHVGLQPFNDKEVREKVYSERKLKSVCRYCIMVHRLNACVQRQRIDAIWAKGADHIITGAID